MTKEGIINALKEKYEEEFVIKSDVKYQNNKYFSEYNHFASTIIERLGDADLSPRECLECISALEIICLNREIRYLNTEAMDTEDENKVFKKEYYISTLNEVSDSFRDSILSLRDTFVNFAVFLKVRNILGTAKTLDEEENGTLKERIAEIERKLAAGENIVPTIDEDDPDEQWIDEISCNVGIAKKLLDIM